MHLILYLCTDRKKTNQEYLNTCLKIHGKNKKCQPENHISALEVFVFFVHFWPFLSCFVLEMVPLPSLGHSMSVDTSLDMTHIRI